MTSSRSLILIVVAVLALGATSFWFFKVRRGPVPPPPSVESVLPKQFLVALKQQQNGGKPVASTATSAPAPAAAAASAAAATPGKALPPLTSPLTFTANGRGQVHISAQNTGDKPTRVALHAGEIYENDQNKIVLLEDCVRDIPPHGMLQADVRFAPVNLAAASSDDTYKKSTTTIPRLDELLTQLKTHPDLSHSAVQTAILLLAENPSLDVFAKFPRLHETQPAAGDFKADTADIIAALQLLSDMGITDRAIASDPQLNIEAMIDPKAHDLALRYYGIGPDMEWAYWKQELLQGDPSLRHYALYGIAEYYPDIALQMLPKWARETRLPAIYRLSAVRAMAMTHRQEAIPILQKMEQEFGPDTDLYRSTSHPDVIQQDENSNIQTKRLHHGGADDCCRHRRGNRRHRHSSLGEGQGERPEIRSHQRNPQ
jgi:hypothetical protein